MKRMQIPGTQKYVYDSSIIILSSSNNQGVNTRWVVHYGLYELGQDVENGWYLSKIPSNDIKPLFQQDLVGCTVIYTPNCPDVKPPKPDSETTITIDLRSINADEIDVESLTASGDVQLGTDADSLLTVYSTTKFYSEIDMNGFTVSNLKEPENDSDAATKQYVDDAIQALKTLLNM